MGISFKVSKTGKRFRSKPPLFESSFDEVSENLKFESDIVKAGEGVARASDFPKAAYENEVSFILNLFSDGYCIGKPSEVMLQDVPKDLRPYDRKSETLFSAIECGRLPGDILEDIPCKYIDGALMCEVRDYRKHTSEQGSIAPSGDEHPVVSKISLKMSLADVVKDIPLISDDSWSYRDLMELESSVVKALQPQLYLDPTPKLDRLCNVLPSIKLNFARSSLQMKRLRSPEITVTSSKNSHGKKICIDSVRESSNPLIPTQHVQDKLTTQNHGPSSVLALEQQPIDLGNQRSTKDHGSQGAMISDTDNINASTNLHGKRDNMDVPKSPSSTLTKKAKLTASGPNGTPQKNIVSRVSDLNWKGTLLQQQAMTSGVQLPSTAIHKNSHQELRGFAQFTAGQKGMRYGPSHLNENKNAMQMMGAEMNQQPRNHQRLPQRGFMEPVIGEHVQKDSRKEERSLKRQQGQSPRFSNLALPQSHLSFKSGEFMQRHHVQAAASISNRSGLLNANSPPVETPPSPVQPMLDNFSLLDMVVTRHKRNCKKNKDSDFICRKPQKYPAREIFTCLSNISNHEDFRDDMKPLSKSLAGGSVHICKRRVVNFIQPEQIVQGNIVSMAPKARTRMVMSEKLDGTVSMYYGDLNDEGFLEMDDHPPLIPNNHMADLLAEQFCRLMSREGYLLDDHIQQEPTGDSHASSSLSPYVPQITPSNSAEELLQYEEAVSDLQPKEAPKFASSNNASFINSSQNLQRTLPPGSSQQQHSQFQRSPMMLATDPVSQLNAQGLNMQLDSHMNNKPSQLQLQLSQQQYQQQQQQHQHQQQHHQQKQQYQQQKLQQYQQQQYQQQQQQQAPPTQQQQQQQHHHQQKQQYQQQQQLQQYQQQQYQQQQQQAPPSQQQQQQAPPSQQQRQHQQQQQYQQKLQQQYQQQQYPQQQQAPPSQQQQQMQRKMTGNTGNNMIGLGNAMGVGGVGMLGAMGNNVGQNGMSLSPSQASSLSNAISQNLLLGNLTPSQAAIMQSKLRVMQSGGSISEPPLAGLGGMPGARQMQSMLGQTANQASTKPVMQYAIMEPMGPPKLKAGTNPYLNQYQQLQQRQQQQLQQNPQQQQQQQQKSYRQMNQPMPMSTQQMSSVANHGTMSSRINPEDCPPAASPQLSSQIPGLVGSIVNSPMDMQGVNKGN